LHLNTLNALNKLSSPWNRDGVRTVVPLYVIGDRPRTRRGLKWRNAMKTTNRHCRLLSVAVIAPFVLLACGNQDDTQVPAPAPPPVAQTTPDTPAIPPPPPQPTPAEQLQERLSQLGATSSDRGQVVTLSSADFAPGQTSFEPADSSRIDNIVQLLKDRSDVHVLIQGYTDSRGSDSRNQTLSQQRAEAVQQALVERGVDATRIRVEGLGEANPVASNDTAEGRQQNRRVEIVFSDAEGRFASANEQPPTG
jgi:outer membrane protein OmpA-like peptidoglycan-associated protein